MQITTVGLDLAKNVFQVHAVNEAGEPVIRRRLRRNQVLPFFAGLPSCLVGLEACSSAHYWARELIALGHDARIIPPTYVKPYVRREKNNSADAAAICEAVSRPSMRFVPVKSEEQKSALMLHKARELLLRQQSMLVNALRAHMAELGIVVPQGYFRFKDILAIIDDDADETIPALARTALKPLAMQLRANREAAAALEAEIRVWHKGSAESRLLETIPGVGVITASAIAALVPDPSFFRSGREFAAWLGLVPRQHSTGGKEKLGRISKQGNRYIRTLLVIGATSVLKYSRGRAAPGSAWINGLLERRPPRLVTVAMANKMARIIWAVMARKNDLPPAYAR